MVKVPLNLFNLFRLVTLLIIFINSYCVYILWDYSFYARLNLRTCYASASELEKGSLKAYYFYNYRMRGYKDRKAI